MHDCFILMTKNTFINIMLDPFCKVAFGEGL
jgi:hypothetical protein